MPTDKSIMRHVKKLNPLECLEWALGDNQPFNIVIEIHGQGKIESARLRQSALLLQQQILELQRRICVEEGQLYFAHQHEQPVPYFYCTENSVDEELNRKFDPQGYLYRICLVEDKNAFRIYLVLHHVLSDGMSACQLARTLLELYDSLNVKKTKCETDWFSLLPIAEQFKTQPPGFAVEYGDQAPLQGKTASQTATIAAREALCFLDSCKKHSVMVQGALTSLVIEALAKSSIDKLFPNFLASHHLVDMRTLLNPPISKSVLQCIISQIELSLERSLNENFWDRADQYSKMINLALEEQVPHKTLEALSQLLFQKQTLEKLKLATSSNQPTICITNIGKVERIPISDLNIINIRIYVTAHGIYQSNSIVLVVNSYADQMNFQFIYPDFFLNTLQMSEFATAFVDSLQNVLPIKSS